MLVGLACAIMAPLAHPIAQMEVQLESKIEGKQVNFRGGDGIRATDSARLSN